MGPLHQWHLAALLHVSKGRKSWEILQSEIIFEPKNCREPHTISICRDDEFSTDQSTRPFIFKEEFSISEGVPAGKVFTTWGVHRDWELQVGLEACAEGLVCQAGS